LANARASEQLAVIKSERDRAEMEHATALAKSEERIEDIESKLASARGDLQFERQCRTDLQQALDSARSSAHTHEEERRAWQTAEDDYRQTMSRVEKAKDDLSAKCTALLADIEGLRQDLATEKETHHNDVEEIKQAHEQRVGALSNEQAEHFRTMQEQHSSKMRRFEETLATARDESHQAEKDFSVQLAKRDKKITDCATKASRPDDQVNIFSALIVFRLSISKRSAWKKTSRSLKPTPCAPTSWQPWVSAT